MAGISEKLYPPTINGTLPAFYDENGTATIVVPFSMNRAVNQNDISGFRLKIKTVQSNVEIRTLDNTSPSIAIAEGKVTFEWPGFINHCNTNEKKKIKLGQYLKVQLAYIHTSGDIGYFSTVGIIKYTAKPNVYIEGLNAARGSTSRSNYVGVFEAGDDKSERPYYYNFTLYDNLGQVIETTDWLLHNTSINNVASESSSLDKTTDSYSCDTALDMNGEYWIQYGVKTINNLEVLSPLYNIAEVDTGSSVLTVGLKAENSFDDGFIALRFYSNNPQINENTQLSSPVSLQILRAEKTDEFQSWCLITQAYFDSYYKALTEWSFKDFTVEQGITYQYCFREYNSAGVQSNRTLSNEVFCDFEDMFLYDGKKQLKIRFNPKVSSFKVTRLETKSDTIGSRYPFIFRNGIVGYKEFPISGLISYLMDDNELFVKRLDDLNILSNSDEAERAGNPIDQNENDISIGKSWELSQTINSVGYNIQAERRFKLKVLDWLGNGDVKLFKSPTEGNYLVRLMNISLSPEDKLGRMLHSFSSTAYEVEECNYNNLYNLGFFNFNEQVKSSYAYKTILLRDVIPAAGGSFKINQDPMVGYVRLELSPAGNSGTSFKIRVGGNEVLVVSPGYFLGTEGTHTIRYPDFYYETGLNNNLTSKADIEAIVQDASLTYMYEQKGVIIGAFHNITDAYLTTVVKTFNGTNNWINFGLYNTATMQQSIIKFYSLKLRQKASKVIYKTSNGNNIIYSDDRAGTQVLSNSSFDELTIYDVIDLTNDPTNETAVSYNWYNNTFSASNKNTQITLRFVPNYGLDENNLTAEDEIITVPQEPATGFDITNYVNNPEHKLAEMYLGDGIFAECAYQVRIIEKKEG